MSALTVGSLFSGIGGLELGLERAGMKVIWQVESDAYARRVLAKHWPSVTLYDDVRRITGVLSDEDRELVSPVDLICGGFPCQDISNAGQRAGIDGERSGLWGEFARLIRELRPRYVLVENVAALLVRGMGRVLGDLAASGYDAEWDCIPAAAVGAPHRRDRLFLVAYPNVNALRQQPKRQPGRSGAPVARSVSQVWAVADADRERQPEPKGRQQDERRRPSDGGESLADAAGLGRGEGRTEPKPARVPILVGPSRADFSDAWAPEPDVGRVAHGVPARVDRLRCLGNAVVPQVAEFIGRLIVRHAEGA